jgi:spore coat polysaccharide biosynthesis protein SpsF (cytidylyltransferase family)
MSLKNDRCLYKRICDATGKEIISIFSPDKPYKVYHQSEWWSDKWDGIDYGEDFNFNKSFFEQFQELVMNVPRIALMNYNSENSEYANYA